MAQAGVEVIGRRATARCPALSPGDMVTHDKFGLGTVVSTDGYGDQAEAKIDFGADYGVKHLVLRYAPLRSSRVDLFEYQAKELFAEYGVPVQRGKVAARRGGARDRGGVRGRGHPPGGGEGAGEDRRPRQGGRREAGRWPG
jgi:hypothetical protein